MIRTTIEFIASIQEDNKKWNPRIKPWFGGESGHEKLLCSKIVKYTAEQENYFVQTFRRQAGGLINPPHRENTDMWFFLAQHYGLLTRLLDCSEGALLILYFVINKNKPNPRVYMLNPHRLNDLAMSIKIDYLTYPLTWVTDKPGYANKKEKC